MAQLNKSRIILLDKFVPSDWYTLITMPGATYKESNTYFHILPKDGKLVETYQRLKGIPHLQVYLKENIPEEFHYKHNRRIMPILIVADDHML